jgi:hypothetical protein
LLDIWHIALLVLLQLVAFNVVEGRFIFNDNPLFYIEKGGIIVKLTVELPNKTMF